MNLLIVESVSSTCQIAAWLGDDWRVEACPGQVRDLPKRQLGIDLDDDFQPTYMVPPQSAKRVELLTRLLRDADVIYLATAPDRDGEVKAWHLLMLAQLPLEKPVFRLRLRTLTEDALRATLLAPGQVDAALVEAGQAARIIDRLLGYLVSPLVSKALNGSYAVGRLQSLLLAQVVQRDRDLRAFQPGWTLNVQLETDGEAFYARLVRIQEATLPLKTRAPLERLAALLTGSTFWTTESGGIAVGKHMGQAYPLELRADLPSLRAGQSLALAAGGVTVIQAQPPDCPTEQALLHQLTQHGIAPPSNPAFGKLLVQHSLVQWSGDCLIPTERGVVLADYLATYFAPLLDVEHHARLEAAINAVASGERTRSVVLRDFWSDFRPLLAEAAIALHESQRETLYGDPARVIASLERRDSKPIVFHPRMEDSA